jgi:hypothetical protein
MYGSLVLPGLLFLFFSMFGFLVSTHLEIFAAIHLVSKSNLDLAPNKVIDYVKYLDKVDEVLTRLPCLFRVRVGFALLSSSPFHST